MVYAISTAPQVGWATTRTIALPVASAILFVAFLVIETRVEAPLMPLRIFRNRSVAAANVAGLPRGSRASDRGFRPVPHSARACSCLRQRYTRDSAFSR